MAALGAGVLLVGALAGCSDDSRAEEQDREQPSASAQPEGDPTSSEEALTDDLRYVALGDSYSSGPRIPDQTGPAQCMRSSNNYPSQVARQLSASEFVDVTCAGAETTSVTASQFPDVAPQLDAVTAETDLVTIGLGGNDFNLFITLVGQCAFARAEDPTGAPCRESMNESGQDRLLADIARIGPRMVMVVRQVRRRAPDAQVIVVGYPQIVPARGTCPELLPLAEGDYPWAHSINKALTDMLAGVARRTTTTYVDLWQATAGHDICAADPWINGTLDAPGRAAPFHPFPAEQRVAAEQVVAALDR